MAVDRVERRLRRVAQALDAASIPYALVGGNAVASWVARVDPSATRATKDVDILVRRNDLDRITNAMRSLGFTREDLRGLILFTDPEEPSRRAGVHLVFAAERIRPSYTTPAPDVSESVRDPSGLAVLDLPALVRMKLTSFRDVDRVHLRDLLDLGLIDDSLRTTLTSDLTERLDSLEADPSNT